MGVDPSDIFCFSALLPKSGNRRDAKELEKAANLTTRATQRKTCYVSLSLKNFENISFLSAHKQLIYTPKSCEMKKKKSDKS